MPSTRVIAIDPAPAKPSTVFAGTDYKSMSAPELRKYLERICSNDGATLICWDAPLTGPTNLTSAGTSRYDYTKRPIERFFSLKETGFKAPPGISVQGYSACSHWTITRSLLGLPRVGPFDEAECRLPLHLLTEPDNEDPARPSVVEIHPGLAAWLWCRDRRSRDANWEYKQNKADGPQIREELWEIILDISGFKDTLPRPKTDDQFDAAVGYILGGKFQQGLTQAPPDCTILGSRQHGSFLLPRIPGLHDAWARWLRKHEDDP